MLISGPMNTPETNAIDDHLIPEKRRQALNLVEAAGRFGDEFFASRGRHVSMETREKLFDAMTAQTDDLNSADKKAGI